MPCTAKDRPISEVDKPSAFFFVPNRKQAHPPTLTRLTPNPRSVGSPRVAARVLMTLVLCLYASSVAADTTFHVAVDGDDGGSGTLDNPFDSVSRAVDAAGPGDQILMRGGVHSIDRSLELTQDGRADAPIRLGAFPGETPTLDFSGVSGGDQGMRLEGDHWQLRGLTIQNAPDNGLFVNGSHNQIERLDVRRNGDSGVQLDEGAAHNLVLNTDSYRNYDPQNHGENADGFAAKFGLGAGNVFRGNRAWANSDDGWDLYEAGEAVRIEKSWAFGNGVNRWDDPQFEGDGNGFKLGAGEGAHELQRVAVWDNAERGIDVNGNTTGVTVVNSTAFRSGTNFQFDEFNEDHVLRNNISLDGSLSIFEIDSMFNTWDLELTVTQDDFRSLDPSVAEGARLPDGSLPVTEFLRLAKDSDLIDAGVDVGLPFNGEAPDLGAFEVPEPATLPIVLLGLVGLHTRRKR